MALVRGDFPLKTLEGLNLLVGLWIFFLSACNDYCIGLGEDSLAHECVVNTVETPRRFWVTGQGKVDHLPIGLHFVFHSCINKWFNLEAPSFPFQSTSRNHYL